MLELCRHPKMDVIANVEHGIQIVKLSHIPKKFSIVILLIMLSSIVDYYFEFAEEVLMSLGDSWIVTPLLRADTNPLRRRIISALNPSGSFEYARPRNPDPFFASVEQWVDDGFDYLEFLTVPLAAGMILIIVLCATLIIRDLRGSGTNNSAGNKQNKISGSSSSSSSKKTKKQE